MIFPHKGASYIAVGKIGKASTTAFLILDAEMTPKAK
jgi:hypothetical protein